MRRLLALLAAAAMVAGAVVIRSRLDADEQDRTDPERVVCAAELGPVCDGVRRTAARVTVEPTATTADRLGRATAEDPGLDGWLVPAPWPQIVDGRRRQASLPPLFGDPGAPLARSPLVLVVENALATTLNSRCGASAPGWKCLGDNAPPARPRHPDPTSGLGTLIVGQATAAFFGRVDDLSTFDLDDAGFARWFRSLETAAPATVSGATPLEEMLGSTFATYNAVGTIEAEARPVTEASALRNRVTVLYPAPMATADVVLAGAAGSDTRRLRDVAGGDTTRKALGDAGWRVAGGPDRTPPLPATNGLPSPGFLDALRSRRP